jgi:Tfp pilus assembly protein PilF
MMLRRPQEAEMAFREEITAFPHHLRAYTNLAAVRLMSRDTNGANANLEEMVQANPGGGGAEAAASFYEALGDAGSAARWRQHAK